MKIKFVILINVNRRIVIIVNGVLGQAGVNVLQVVEEAPNIEVGFALKELA